MTINEILSQGGDVEASAKAFIKASATFLETLSKNNLTLDMGSANSSDVNVDYDAPVMDSYIKTYRPIDASEIITANKEMAEALAGEKWISGFLTCVKLFLLFAPK